MIDEPPALAFISALKATKRLQKNMEFLVLLLTFKYVIFYYLKSTIIIALAMYQGYIKTIQKASSVHEISTIELTASS